MSGSEKRSGGPVYEGGEFREWGGREQTLLIVLN